MATAHRNKTLAVFLALVAGAIGAHRFYLRGRRDFWGWAHLLTLPVSLLAIAAYPDRQAFFMCVPLILSALCAIIETLALGLMSDEKWDSLYNPDSGRKSNSAWPLALLLVFAVGGGATFLIAVLARSLDLWLTGGAQG